MRRIGYDTDEEVVFRKHEEEMFETTVWSSEVKLLEILQSICGCWLELGVSSPMESGIARDWLRNSNTKDTRQFKAIIKEDSETPVKWKDDNNSVVAAEIDGYE